jgi:hypothetical protein
MGSLKDDTVANSDGELAVSLWHNRARREHEGRRLVEEALAFGMRSALTSLETYKPGVGAYRGSWSARRCPTNPAFVGLPLIVLQLAVCRCGSC